VRTLVRARAHLFYCSPPHACARNTTVGLACTDEWREYMREHEGKRWDELPFYWLEAYYYRYG